jgi:hypothetical protein
MQKIKLDGPVNKLYEDQLKFVRNIGVLRHILILRINILIMTNSSDLVIILYVHVFKFNLLLNKNIIQNMNQR